MQTDELTIYQKDMSCNQCLTNVVTAISTLKYLVGFDIDLKEKRVTLIYESGQYEKQTLTDIIQQAVQTSEDLCPAFI